MSDHTSQQQSNAASIPFFPWETFGVIRLTTINQQVIGRMQTILNIATQVHHHNSQLISVVLQAPRPKFMIAPYQVRFVATGHQLAVVEGKYRYVLLEPRLAKRRELEAMYEELLYSWNLRLARQPRKVGVSGL